ncbi:MAG: Ig-like domain-containing protein, partial [Candidatus Paceibacterota bacterium]
ILSDEQARVPTFGSHSALFIPDHAVAVKTGTTNSNKDAWTIGYTPSIVVGVWAGNNDNKTMKKGGSAVAGPIWNKFINEALKTLPNEQFEYPNLAYDPNLKPILRGYWQGNESFRVDSVSGGLANEFTPPETTVEKIVTNVHSILYWVDKNDPLGPPPANPANDPQFNHWEIPVRNWWARSGGGYGSVTIGERPVTTDSVHTDSSKPVISIAEPNAATTYPSSQKIVVRVSSSGPYPLAKIDVFVNGVYLGTSTTSTFSFTPSELSNIQAENQIKIIGYDTVFNTGETSSVFRVGQ